MKVPLLDLKEQLAPLRDEIIQALTRVVDSTCYILGPEVESFEQHVADYCKAEYAIGVASGTDALLGALMALDVGPGDYVITTPYSFFATMGSVVRLGARPLFIDIDPVTYNIDPSKLAEFFENEKELANKVKVILPVHLYGQCADMTEIMKIAEAHNIPVVEDAAQAIGAACPIKDAAGAITWQKAGTMGAAGCFSFFPSKNLGGIGDGGMIVCNDRELAELIRIIRVHGGAPKYHHKIIGGNFRLDPVQAVVLDLKLPYLSEWHQKRRQNAQLYDRLFTASELVGNKFINIPQPVYKDLAADSGQEPDYHIYNQYVIRVENRDELKSFLQEADIITEIYYPIPLHKQECLTKYGYNEQHFPHAEQAAKDTLALPIYPELTDAMQEYVVEKIAQFYK